MHTSTTPEALKVRSSAGMETFLIISSAVVVSLVATFVKIRKLPQRNLGYVSRDWVMRHGMDHTSV